MGLFGRKRDAAPSDEVQDVATDDAAVDEAQDATDGAEPARGPWDVDATGFRVGPRVDLGAIRVPAVSGMELRMEMDKASNVVTTAAVLYNESTLQLQAFAAPRTEGVWDDIRTEIAESIASQGGSSEELSGPFGTELLARLPVEGAAGRTGHRPARFIGVDGPRWFLRGVITGKGAIDPVAARPLESVFSEVIVVRGTQARAPRDLLALTLPPDAVRSGAQEAAPAEQEAPGALKAPDFDPLTRGPEITEVH